MRKGVSPLIAVVFLIAVVMSAAFLFGEWVEPFTKQQTAGAENASDEFHTCRGVWVRILDISYTQDEVNVTVMNSGEQDLSSVTVKILGAGQIIDQEEIAGMDVSDHGSVRLDAQGNTPEQLIVIPEDCPRMTTETALS